jgi:hypothetical protein
MKVVAVESDLPQILNISATPSPTGNTVGLGHYVVDDKGSTYFIDRSGKAVLLRKLTTDWVEPELLNGFESYNVNTYGKIRFRVNDGILYIQGMTRGGENNKAIFRLSPEIYQYISKRHIIATDRSGSANARIDIKGNGVVIGHNISTSWTSIDLSISLDL